MKLLVNIDSLPADRFDESELVAGDYEVTGRREVKITPGFAFLWEFLLGKPPAKTGLWMDYVLSDKSPYAFLKRFKQYKVPNRGPLMRHLLMNLARLSGRKGYNPQNIPLGLLGHFKRHPDAFPRVAGREKELFARKYGVNSVNTFSGGVNEVRSRVLNSESEFTYANFSELDHVGHVHGPNSHEYTDYTQEIFDVIQEIEEVRKFQEIQLMSDHGMYEVNNYIDWREFLQPETPFFVNSPMIRLWNPNEDSVNSLRDLEEEGLGKVLTDADYETYNLPRDPAYGDTIFWLKKGNFFRPDFFWGDAEVKGMHGYWGWDKTTLLTLSD